LLPSSAFKRNAKRYAKKNPSIAAGVEATLTQLSEDPFHPSLKSHRLKGALAGSWACSVGYDLRIVFSFVRHSGSNAILLESVGTHDEAY
jgi:mRNA interferase YafQ